MSQLLPITDFDLPPDQVQSFLSTTFYFSFLDVFFALFCFLFLCLLLLVAVNVAFHGEQELRRLQPRKLISFQNRTITLTPCSRSTLLTIDTKVVETEK